MKRDLKALVDSTQNLVEKLTGEEMSSLAKDIRGLYQAHQKRDFLGGNLCSFDRACLGLESENKPDQDVYIALQAYFEGKFN